MNQILVTEKLYVTPELKRKKKLYKFEFIISIFILCVLTSLYIYAEYDRNRAEETSQEILLDLNQLLSNTEEDTSLADNDILLVVLNSTEEEILQAQENAQDIPAVDMQPEKRTTASGYTYVTIATINIPKLNKTFPVLQGETGSLEETEDLLKISPVKYHGYEPNDVGNFCIVGHNYRNDRFFSKVPTLEIGDTIELTDLSNRTLIYEVYDKHVVDPSDTRDTTQVTGGRKEVTLITCTNDSKQRVIVRCKEVK